MRIIDKKTVEHLAELARIEIPDTEKEKLAGDLENILKHFEELKEVNTDKILPMNGGTTEMNVMREDETSEIRNKQQVTRDKKQETRDKFVREFSEEKDGFLKVPAVFE